MVRFSTVKCIPTISGLSFEDIDVVGESYKVFRKPLIRFDWIFTTKRTPEIIVETTPIVNTGFDFINI